MNTRCLPFAAALSLFCGVTHGQFLPAQGEWGKTSDLDIRVVAYNVQDALCSTAIKNNSTNDWAALARIIAALKPDVLLLQETGDNRNNGTGSSGDSAFNLTTALDRFVNGGDDPFRGGVVTEYVRLYDPDVEFPHIFVSGTSDGSNRNAILSRFPFVDLNGDGRSTTSSFVTVNGDSEVRGIQFAELDLPDNLYPGDFVVSNAHLKAFGDATSRQRRIDAAQAMATYIQNLYNGDGTDTPDPENRVFDIPPAQRVLDPLTPVVWGGDYNEDEATNGRVGPVQLTTNNYEDGSSQPTGSDGTDADGTDATADRATRFFTGSRTTQRSGSKLDWIMYQDSKTQPRNQFIFATEEIPTSLIPPEVVGFRGSGQQATAVAADHYPVVVDFIVAVDSPDLAPQPFALLTPAEGEIGIQPFTLATWEDLGDADRYELTISENPDLSDPVLFLDNLPAALAFVSVAEPCTTYFWAVDAINPFGTTRSAVQSFSGTNPAEQNGDGVLNGADFNAWLANFQAGLPAADVNADGDLDGADFNAWLAAFGGNCP